MPITAVMGEREAYDATLGEREEFTTEVLGSDQSEVAAVLFVKQSLSVSQQAQARQNIGITGTGADGYSPVRGKDYWTDADKSEMVSAVIDALPVYNGEVVEV